MIYDLWPPRPMCIPSLQWAHVGTTLYLGRFVCINHQNFSSGPPCLSLLLNLGILIWMLQVCNSVPLYVAGVPGEWTPILRAQVLPEGSQTSEQ